MTYGQELAAIVDANYERTAEDPLRTHLGASIIGGKCQRAIWFAFFWCAVEIASGRMIRLWARGQREEEVFVEHLQRVGAVVWQTDPTTGQQFRVSAFGGHFGGSCDGFVDKLPHLEPAPRLAEFKTHNAKSFANLKAQGVASSKPQHFKQMQIYMHLFNIKGWPIKEALYGAVNKDTDELYFEIVAYDPSVGYHITDKAEMIIFGEGMPSRISETPSWYECKFCIFNKICFKEKFPLINCRTCAFSKPKRDGSWSCSKGKLEIKSCPKIGCEEHVYKTELI